MIAEISVLIAFLALGFSLFAFLDGRKKDRRDIFLQIHQLLISEDLRRGRFILFQKITDEDSVERLSDGEWRDVDRALSTYNALGLYIAHRYVKERDVMDLWAEPIFKAWKAAQPYIAYRKRLGDPNPWKYLDFLKERAVREISRTDGDLELKIWQREPYRGQRLTPGDPPS
jgi:hypothetical protein